ACEIKAAFVRRSTASIDLVANAICDWKSIRTSAWFVGLRRLSPGEATAVIGLIAPFSMIAPFRLDTGCVGRCFSNVGQNAWLGSFRGPAIDGRRSRFGSQAEALATCPTWPCRDFPTACPMARAKWNRPKCAARRRCVLQRCQHSPVSVAPPPFSHTQLDQIDSLPAELMLCAPFGAGAAHVVQLGPVAIAYVQNQVVNDAGEVGDRLGGLVSKA